MKCIIFIFMLLPNLVPAHFGNSPATPGNEFNKEASVYKAKGYLMYYILGYSNDVVRFDVDALPASDADELTTLVYKCESKNKSGLLLAFNGLRATDSSVNQESSYKNLPMKEAQEFCEKVEIALKVNSDYLGKDLDNNNIYFIYSDIAVLMYRTIEGIKLRVFWNGYDAEWDYNSFTKAAKRLKKEINR